MIYTDSDHYFSEPDNTTLCRLGGNGPLNISQIMPILKYVDDGDSFLDVGCGSGTTLDALNLLKKVVVYKGTDFIEHRIEYLKRVYPNYKFEVEDARYLNEKDQSWDVVWSRHVVEHTNSFEATLDEHCRVAKRKVICILFRTLKDGEHDIRNVVYGDRTYQDEFYNQYSKDKIKKYLTDKSDFIMREFLEGVSWNGSKLDRGDDTIIVLERVNEKTT